MIKTIALIVVALLVVVIGGVLAYAATKPDTFRVQRTTTIQAPPERVFPLLEDFRTWGTWSPYEGKDPAMKRTYSGSAKGKGAVYAWEGDKNVGTGSMEIADTTPPSRSHAQARFHQAVRSPQHGRFHARAEGRFHHRHLGDARSGSLHGEDHARPHQYGPHGGKGFRGRSRQPQGRRRNEATVTG